MQVQVEELSPVEKKLSVEVPWERVREKLDAAYKELAKGVRLKGFRPGKVPRAVVEKMFSKQVYQEVAKELVQESFLVAAQEHKLEPVAEPVIEEARIKPNEAFRYTARVEVRSPVELKDWEGLPARRRPVEIKEQEVEHQLEHLRLQHAEYKAIDPEKRKETAATDVVFIAVEGTVGEHTINRPELTVDLGHTDREPLPGLARALIGLPIGPEKRRIVLDIPADAPQKEIAGRTANLEITIKDAREKQVPALDDEFAKDTGEADTLADLRAKLRERLESAEKKDADREMRDRLLKELVKRNPLPVAPALIERAVDAQVERLRLQLAMQGIDMEQALQHGQGDPRAIRDRLRDSAADEVRGQLMLQHLAETHDVSVSDAELDARVAEIAKGREKPVAKVKAELERDGSLESLRFRLRQEKALDLVVARATITEAPDPEPTAAAPEEPAQESR
jgi:trigger factor